VTGLLLACLFWLLFEVHHAYIPGEPGGSVFCAWRQNVRDLQDPAAFVQLHVEDCLGETFLVGRCAAEHRLHPVTLLAEFLYGTLRDLLVDLEPESVPFLVGGMRSAAAEHDGAVLGLGRRDGPRNAGDCNQ